MASRGGLVNLDAMIARADFAADEPEESSFENVGTISLRDFTSGALIGPNLRKPDFQRETNHWSPEQVVSRLEASRTATSSPLSFSGDRSRYLFVIDGGHRLSALRAWVTDDYGDGPISQQFFGFDVSNEQKRAAARARALVNARLGTWQHVSARLQQDDLGPDDRKRYLAITTRALPIQWVTGDAGKAENSFFKINTAGTSLDAIEELLLRCRKRAVPIAARAVIRAGTGHRYWSSFAGETQKRSKRRRRRFTLCFLNRNSIAP